MAGDTKMISVSDLRGVLRLSLDAAIGATHVTQGVHQTVLNTPGPFGVAARGLTGGVAGLVYRSLRGGLRVGGAGADRLLALFDDRTSAPSAQRDRLIAALNGVFGDHLAATHNPLAIPMAAFGVGGNPLPLERAALAAALPGASGRVLVVVHGLCMSERAWSADLLSALNPAPVAVRYNSGLHVSINGRAFAEWLETLVAQWPTPVESLAIVGHSMGGLVARSACHYGEAAGHGWRRRLSRMVFLGTPHHGAPLEKLGAWVDHLMGAVPYAAVFGRIGKARSAGIADLRFGALIDEDWRDRDDRALLGDCRRPIPLPEGVACHAIAATLAAEPGRLHDRLVGDGLVPVSSALGEHADPARRLDFEPERRRLFTGMDHFDLLSRPEIFGLIRGWLEPDGATG